MKITDEMVRRGSNEVDWLEGDVRKALEAALAPYEAPPFVLSDVELMSVDVVRHAKGPVERQVAWDLLRALDRALKTLGVAPAAPAAPTGEDRLTAEERGYIEYRRSSSVGPWLAIIDRLAPKPAPAARTNEELAHMAYFGLTADERRTALDELVRRANLAEVK